MEARHDRSRGPHRRSIRRTSPAWMVTVAVALMALAPLVAPLGPAVAQGSGEDPAEDPAEGPAEAPARLIVGFLHLPSGIDVGSEYEGATVVDRNRGARFLVVETDEPDRFTDRAHQDDRVHYVEEDVVLEDLLTFTPNDPHYSLQYAPQQVKAPGAWDTTLGSTDKAVCVIDTGVRSSHEELTGSRWLGGHDYVHGDTTPEDDHGHGTHVAGIAAAGVNNAKGIAGAGNMGLLGVKAFNSGGGTTVSWIANSITWCADNGGDVISMSFGGPSGHSSWDAAIDYAWGQGSLLVAAAGNDGCNNCIGYPARHAKVIAVTCTTSSESVCSFSSTGPEAELAAPGSGILSLSHTSNTGYTTKSGTSMSTPLVSGVATLVWTAAPSFTNQEMRDLLTSRAADRGSAGRDNGYGYGIVDAEAAMNGLVPSAPRSLTVDQGSNGQTLELAWLAPESSGSSPITGYRVYRAVVDGSGAPLDQVAELGVVNAYTDTGLEHATTYRYRVSAFSDTGEGALSDEARNTTLDETPSVPLNLTAARGPGDGNVTVTWDPPSTTHGHALVEYRVYRGTDPDPDAMSLVGTVAAGTTEFVDAGLPEATTFYYAVSAVNTVGEGALTVPVLVRTLGPPIAPDDTWAVRGDQAGEVDVQWTVPVDDGGFPITAYRVYRGTDPAALVQVAEVDGSTLMYTDPGLDDATQYYYAVSALNERGEGELGPVVAARTPSAPSEPLSVAASRADVRGAIELAWDVPADDGGLPITAFRVYRGTDPGALSFIAEVPVGTLAYEDTGLADATSYHYAASAVNEVGEGALSAIASATTATLPSEPRSTDVTPGPDAGTLTVTWVPPADTGGLTIDAYRIYRHADGEPISFVAQVTGTLSYADEDLPADHFMCYAVGALNDVGEGPLSTEACAGTVTEPDAPQDVEAVTGPNKGRITLTWEAPAFDGGAQIANYRVYRGAGPDEADMTLVAELGDVRRFIDSGLPDGSTWFYRVSAFNGLAEGPTAEPVQVRAPALPSAPQAVRATAGPGVAHITVRWGEPADDGGLPVIGHRIYYSAAGDRFQTNIADVDGSTFVYVDDGPWTALPKAHYYAVSAVTLVGEGPRSAPVCGFSPPWNVAGLLLGLECILFGAESAGGRDGGAGPLHVAPALDVAEGVAPSVDAPTGQRV